MGIQERRERERKARRARFIEVARRLFLDRGYEATSIEDITTAAEFSKRTLYLYFADKREIFLAVTLEALDSQHQAMQAAAQDAENGLEGALRLGAAYFAFSQEREGDFRMILDFEAQEYHLHRERSALGEFAARCVEVNDRNTELLLDCICRGQQDGSIRPDVRPVELMLVMWAQAIGIIQVINMRRSQLADPVYETSAASLFDLTLQNIRRALTDASKHPA